MKIPLRIFSFFVTDEETDENESKFTAVSQISCPMKTAPGEEIADLNSI